MFYLKKKLYEKYHNPQLNKFFFKKNLSPFVTALLLDTLKVIQRSVCNDEIVALACPRGTTISIQVAQYGKAGEEQGCPALSNEEVEASRNCKRPNAMQVGYYINDFICDLWMGWDL